ncbi:MAG: NAD-dependent epimerase/dehydratase family protein [Nocardioides sp.]|nr:NAD-dependent epimerase/dehydratase family protein [Nocardioides sp.]
MSRTALVTGVAGFVGPHLVRELVDAGWDVVGVDHDPGPPPAIADQLCGYVGTDLTAGLPLDQLPAGRSIDAVVHLAGRSTVGPSFAHPQDYLSANTAMTTAVGEALLAHVPGARWLVVSTGALYDPTTPGALGESAPLACASPYAVSKAAVEHQADYYARRGLDVVVVRPFNHLGPGQREGFLLTDLLAGLHRWQESGTPVTVGDLDTARDYTDVRDVCRAYRLLIETPDLPHRLFNVCSGVATPGRAVLDALVAGLGLDEPELHVDPARLRPTDPRTITGSAERLRAATGWTPRRSLAETVRDAAEA